MGQIFNHNTGKALNKTNSSGTNLSYITTSNLYWGSFELDTLKQMYFTESEIEKCTVRHGDLLVCEGGDIGRAAIWNYDYEIRIQNHIHKLRPFLSVNVKLYFYVFWLYKFSGRISGKGIGIQGLSSNQLHNIIIPLPPLQEQNHIVSKINKLLNIVDTIEINKTDLQSTVQQAKSKILDLAIRGKLVPQDPNDEPASVLLERIRAEKEELIKQGKIKRDKKKSVIFKGDDNSYYDIDIPEHWEVVSLALITKSISDGSHNPPPDSLCGIPILSAANIFNNAVQISSATRWVTKKDWLAENKRTNIEMGDVLLTIVGSIGRSAVVNTDAKFALQRSVAAIKPMLMNPEYLMYLFESPTVAHFFEQNSKGTAQKGIYLNSLRDLIILVPPLAEQKRIVAAIETYYKELDKIAEMLA